MSQRDQVKKKLLRDGYITNVEATKEMGIFRLSERIRELQAAGMKIEGDWVRVDGKRTGTYKYTLTEKPKRFVYERQYVNGRWVAVAKLA